MPKQRKIFTLILIAFTIFSASACGGKSDAEIAAEGTLQAIYIEETLAAAEPVNAGEQAAPDQPTPEPLMTPGEPPPPERTLEDSDASIKAAEKRVLSGDNFLDNLYERPFTAIEMVYQPDLDIYTVDFAYDDAFYYFTITLNGLNPQEWGLNGMYGVEFDRTKTGRGDLIVWAQDPGAEWSMENVVVLADANGDVGGPVPVVADAGFNGSGYDQAVELGGRKTAFARVSPDNETAVQIAVSSALLENPPEFLWGAWADNGLKDSAMFDYNDTMGPSAAGSPFIVDPDYPVNGLYNLDNTCRLPYGFDQMSAAVPGMCITSAPAEQKDGCIRYCVEWALINHACIKWICR